MRKRLGILTVAFALMIGLSYSDYAQSENTGSIAFGREDSIFIIDSDGQNERLLVEGNRAAFSSTGDRIAFDRDFEIFVINLETLAETQVTFFNNILALGPSWAPNDESLVFWESGSTDDAGNTLSVERIFKVDLNILFTSPLTGENNASWQPAWSPSGDQILFAEFDGSDWELVLIDSDGQNRLQLTDNETVDWEPAWSPDGERIAYSDRNNIFIMNSDGTEISQITVGSRRSIEPAWSPDGTEIVFSRWNQAGDDTDLYVVNTNGSDLRQLTSTPDERERNPAWGP